MVSTNVYPRRQVLLSPGTGREGIQPPHTARGPQAAPSIWSLGTGPSSHLDGFHVDLPPPSDLILALGILAQGLPVSRHTKVPWRQLFRKPSVWAAIISQLSAACSFFILLSWLPTFFKETFPSSKGWVFNVVPWLVAIPASLLSGLLSDHLINQGYRTITVRKFMQVMGLGLSSVFALCLGHTSSFCNSVVFASASIGLQTFNHSGISVNIQDLAPSCAGFLFGVANTAGALAGVVGVCLGGYLIETTGSWTSVFNLVAAISSLGLCTFLVFGKAQRVDLSPAHEDL